MCQYTEGRFEKRRVARAQKGHHAGQDQEAHLVQHMRDAVWPSVAGYASDVAS